MTNAQIFWFIILGLIWLYSHLYIFLFFFLLFENRNVLPVHISPAWAAIMTIIGFALDLVLIIYVVNVYVPKFNNWLNSF